MFKLEFETGNAAFDETEEISRILRDVARRIETGATSGKIRDTNGNAVGSFSFDREG